MSRKKVSRNAPCPCGSGKKYKHCCYNKGFEWQEDEQGQVYKSIPMNDEMAGILEQQPDLSGLYHVSSEPIDKYHLLCLLREAFRVPMEVEPYPAVQIDRSLDSSRFRALTGFQPPAWPAMIQEMAKDQTPYAEWRLQRGA